MIRDDFDGHMTWIWVVAKNLFTYDAAPHFSTTVTKIQ